MFSDLLNRVQGFRLSVQIFEMPSRQNSRRQLTVDRRQHLEHLFDPSRDLRRRTFRRRRLRRVRRLLSRDVALGVDVDETDFSLHVLPVGVQERDLLLVVALQRGCDGVQLLQLRATHFCVTPKSVAHDLVVVVGLGPGHLSQRVAHPSLEFVHFSSEMDSESLSHPTNCWTLQHGNT